MTPVLNAVGIVTSEMARSLEFYRHLGLDVPDTPEEGHVNIDIANGIRLMTGVTRWCGGEQGRP